MRARFPWSRILPFAEGRLIEPITVAFIAEGFYAYRISLLSQSYIMAGVILLVRTCTVFQKFVMGLSLIQLATVQLAGSIAAAVVLRNAGLFSKLLGVQYSITASVRRVYFVVVLDRIMCLLLTDLEWRKRVV